MPIRTTGVATLTCRSEEVEIRGAGAGVRELPEMWLAGQLIADYQLQRCTGFWPVSCSSHTPLFHSQGVGVGGFFLTFPEAQAAALARGAKFKVVHATVDLARKVAKQEGNLRGHNPPEDLHLFSGLGQSQIAEQHQPQWLRNPWSIERRPPHPPCAHCGEVDAWEL